MPKARDARGWKILKSGPLRVHLQHCGAKRGECLNRTKTTLNSGFFGGGGGEFPKNNRWRVDMK